MLQDISSGYLEFCKVNNFESDLSKQKNKAVINISGLGVYDLFKDEIGLHCLSQNKQSLCQVFVFDNSYNKKEFDEKDVEIITCRSSGAGGQHINTTDSSIKATHIPTSICAVSQDERSQFQKATCCMSPFICHCGKGRSMETDKKQKKRFHAKRFPYRFAHDNRKNILMIDPKHDRNFDRHIPVRRRRQRYGLRHGLQGLRV